MKIVYGPVSSWRLGSSLGVDLICSDKKICSFDCIYCQLGKEPEKTNQRKNFIDIDKMRKELIYSLEEVTPDVITFSGTGEPTLAKNLDEAIKETRKITDIPLAIITNSTLMNNKDVIKILCKLDIVVAKLDASNERLFKEINQPFESINFKDTFNGIKKFKEKFSGKLDIQIMFIKNNMDFAEDIANIVSEIQPDEVQINTPLRPCAVKPLSENQLARIEKIFKDKGLKTTSVYTSPKPKTSPIDKIEIFKRRRNYR
jgi:wyosine [tRNA(Phe)-imidazoG37] synthetase (radical SAM superfamily)